MVSTSQIRAIALWLRVVLPRVGVPDTSMRTLTPPEVLSRGEALHLVPGLDGLTARIARVAARQWISTVEAQARLEHADTLSRDR
jgi:hypothetical protein